MLRKPVVAPLIGIAVFLSVGLVGEYGLSVEKQKIEQNRRARVNILVGNIRVALESELNSSLYLANGLVSYVKTYPQLEPAAIRGMLKSLYDQSPYIRNIGIAPGNRLTYIFPEKGNEQALGLYYPDLPDQWPAVQRAMTMRQPVLAGPVTLKQGGVGLIYRIPVFSPTPDDYWGMVSTVLDSNKLFDRAGVSPQMADLEFAIRAKNGHGTQANILLGNAKLFEGDVITEAVNIPGGSWQIAAAPKNGWVANSGIEILHVASWFVAALGGLITYLLFSRAGRRLKAESALRESEQRLRGLYTLSPLGIALAGMDGRFIDFNDSFREICGYSEAELKKLDYWELTPKKYAEAEAKQLELLSRTGRYSSYEKEYMRKDGSLVPLRLNGMLIEGADGKKYIWSIVENITQWKQAEKSLQAQKDTLSIILENSTVGITLVKERRQIWANRHMAEMFGYSCEEMQDQSTRLFYPDQKAYEAFGKEAYARLAGGRKYTTEIQMRKRDGIMIWVRLSGQTIDASDPSQGSIWIFEDITDKKKAEVELIYQATMDSLTGVMNRRRFHEQMMLELARSKRTGKMAAVLMADIDHFKAVNDSYGHAIGDIALRHFTDTVTRHLRRTDTIGRLGGEEFAVLLPETEINGAHLFAERLRQVIASSPAPSSAGPIAFTVSIGVTTFGRSDTDSEAIIARADVALYQAKESGRNRVVLFQNERAA